MWLPSSRMLVRGGTVSGDAVANANIHIYSLTCNAKKKSTALCFVFLYIPQMKWLSAMSRGLRHLVSQVILQV